MDSLLNTEKLFHDENYSDIVVQFSGKEIKCHKIILCTKSVYFRKLCGPGSSFKARTRESKSNTVELKEDHPDAVEAVLWHIYSGKTESSRPDDWLHDLHVSKAAEKYLLPDLEAAAFSRFQKTTDAITEPGVVLSAIHTIREVGDHPKHLEVAAKLEEKHQSALLKNQEYRSIVEEDKELLWKHMDRLNFADDLVKEHIHATTCKLAPENKIHLLDLWTDYVLGNKSASISFYMVHGGTNFGFDNSALWQNRMTVFTTASYDYSAPIDESGRGQSYGFILSSHTATSHASGHVQSGDRPRNRVLIYINGLQKGVIDSQNRHHTTKTLIPATHATYKVPQANSSDAASVDT
ncbi:hypothetical protein SEPMUDRAFT_147200 [Lecanosticta acicola]|uniref:BTB domain-containing protein n=1 Tax=Lecanosticta acicola TaxID=111012 RepID=A0AAI9EDJ4_9PEZI|nr:hypothetical protein SEPMUDRAFT_147200 [Lecanosticta acicola]